MIPGADWFLLYRDAVTADFAMGVKHVEKMGATTIVAALDQHYLYGPEKADRRVSYEAKFSLTPAGWKADCVAVCGPRLSHVAQRTKPLSKITAPLRQG